MRSFESVTVVALAFGVGMLSFRAEASKPNDPLMSVLVVTGGIIHRVETATLCRKRTQDWATRVTSALTSDLLQMKPAIDAEAPYAIGNEKSFVAGMRLRQISQSIADSQESNNAPTCDQVSNAPEWTAYLADADKLAR